MKSVYFFLPLLTATYAAAHGWVGSVTIDGQVYKGMDPSAPPANVQSTIRQVASNSPVKGAANPDINCGLSAVPSALIANANPGSSVQVQWTDGGGNWPHNTGPMLTYLTSCGSTPCSQFNSSAAQWFKIEQVGQNSNGGWVQAELTTGSPASLTLPSNLAPGNYIMRHEVISLQGGVSLGGAEFYPSCTQLQVGGSQTGTPSASDLVTFPGAYKDTDPGIFVPNVYNPGFTYTFPGPPIASFISGASGSGGSSSSNPGGSSSSNPGGTSSSNSGGPTYSASTSSSTSTDSGVLPTSTGSSSSTVTTTGSCRLKSPTSASASPSSSAYAAIVRPRHLSRVMRRLLSGNTH